MATIIPADDYSPRFQGDTAKPLVVRVVHINGVEDLTGATFSLSMQSVEDPDIIKMCTGPWDVSSETAIYSYQPEDVDTVGSWKLWIKMVIDGDTGHLDDGKGEGEPKVLVIKPLPSGV